MRGYDPFREIEEMMRRMMDIFSRYSFDDFAIGGKYITGSFNYAMPKYNIEDAGEYYLIQVELPGVDKKDINLEADDHRIYIKVEKKEEENREKQFSSKYYGTQIVIGLQEQVDPEKIEVSYQNGLLEIRAPKKDYKGKRKLLIP
jgi:HSP20 family protein